jgi:hypothetical protein
MSRRIAVGAAVLGAIVLMAIGWLAKSILASDFEVVNLRDGRSLIILKDFDQAYPVYAKTLKAEVDLALEQRKQMFDATAGGKYESDVKRLYENLDAINADARTAVVAAYTGLVLRVSANAEPSQVAEAFSKWDEVLQLVIREAARVRTINQRLAAVRVATSGSGWEGLLLLAEESRRGATEIASAAAALRVEPNGSPR